MVGATHERNSHKPSRHACPQCGAPVFKDHRRLRDRLVSIFYDVRRYHCKACHWEGLLAHAETGPSSANRLPRSRIVWTVVIVLLIPLVGLLAGVLWIGDRAKPLPVAATPVQTTAATSPQPNDPGKEGAGLSGEVRDECVWGGPGEAPYLGTLSAALTTARLPSEIVEKFEIMREGHLETDRLSISSAGIQSADGRRHFGHTTKAMALGSTLCFGTRINMPPDTITFADLYELIDATNQRYTIMVVVRGGNVAVLEEKTEH